MGGYTPFMITEEVSPPKLLKGPRGGIRFNGRLSELLAERYGLQAEVARAAGVNPSTIKRLSEGHLGCNPAIAQHIADALKESLDTLRAPV